jgi:multisubunit Na+/H+ antiporter MnhC subunit
MTPQQISKVWTVISLVLLYYALNTYLVTQGGNEIFGTKLIVTSRIPAAMMGIPICSALLLVSSLIGIDYAP